MHSIAKVSGFACTISSRQRFKCKGQTALLPIPGWQEMPLLEEHAAERAHHGCMPSCVYADAHQASPMLPVWKGSMTGRGRTCRMHQAPGR